MLSSGTISFPQKRPKLDARYFAIIISVGDAQMEQFGAGRTARTLRFSRLALPDSKAPSLKAANLKAPTLRTRKLILVVDDDPSMLKAIERALKLHGFDAELFNSVEEFETRANLQEAACLVLDVNLNGKSGIDLRRRIAMWGISIPAVFITGNDNPKARKAAKDADCSAF